MRVSDKLYCGKTHGIRIHSSALNGWRLDKKYINPSEAVEDASEPRVPYNQRFHNRGTAHLIFMSYFISLNLGHISIFRLANSEFPTGISRNFYSFINRTSLSPKPFLWTLLFPRIVFIVWGM